MYYILNGRDEKENSVETCCRLGGFWRGTKFYYYSTVRMSYQRS